MTLKQEKWIAEVMAADRARKDALWEDRIEGIADIKIALIRSSDDPPLFSSESQAEIEGVRRAFRNEGIEAHTPFMVMDSPDGGGGYVGEFIIQVAQIGIPAVTAIIGAWLHAKLGRKLRVDFYADGKIKRIEAQTPEEIRSMVEATCREAQPKSKKKSK